MISAARHLHITTGLLTIALATGCANNQPATAPDNFITGTITYDAVAPLSSEAELVVKLLDVSLQDIAAKELGTTVITNPGPPPVNFRVEYDPAAIVAVNTYSVRATLYERGQMRFTTDTFSPVLTRGAGTTVNLRMIRIQPKVESAVISLTGTFWQLQTIDNETFVAAADQPIPYVLLEAENNAASGNAGCNRFAGTYTRDGDKLSMGPLAITAMACIDGMDAEQAFTARLGQMNRYEISDNLLYAYRDDALLMTFTASAEPL